jgi:proline racemase
MDAAGYHDMCGHATIGVVTTLVEYGLIDVADGEQEIAVDTPAGRIRTRVTVVAGKAASVTFINQPAFFLESFTITSPVGELEIGVAYGGQWYAFVKVLKLRKSGAEEFAEQRELLQNEYAATRRLYKALRSRPGLVPLRPIAIFPEQLAIVTAEVSGERFEIPLKNFAMRRVLLLLSS